jgi:hypothetical protein
MGKFSDSNHDILKTYFDILKAPNTGDDNSYILSQNHTIVADGSGTITTLYQKNTDNDFVGHNFRIISIDGNTFRFQYEGMASTHNVATSLQVGEELYFRKDQPFRDWLVNNSDTYENFINVNKTFVYFGKLSPVDDSTGQTGVQYNVIYDGMKDFVMDALPAHNQTTKLTEMMDIYFDKVYHEIYNMTKTMWSFFDAKEVDIDHLDLLASRAGIMTDKNKMTEIRLRDFIDNIPYWLKRKGSYSSFYIIYKILFADSKNKLNLYEKWCEWCLRNLRGDKNWLLATDFEDHHINEYYGQNVSGGAGPEYYNQFSPSALGYQGYPPYTTAAPSAACITQVFNCGNPYDLAIMSGTDANSVLTQDSEMLEIASLNPSGGLTLYGTPNVSSGTFPGGHDAGTESDFRHQFTFEIDSASQPSGGPIIWAVSDTDAGSPRFTTAADQNFDDMGNNRWVGVQAVLNHRDLAGQDRPARTFRLLENRESGIISRPASAMSTVAISADTAYEILIEKKDRTGVTGRKDLNLYFWSPNEVPTTGELKVDKAAEKVTLNLRHDETYNTIYSLNTFRNQTKSRYNDWTLGRGPTTSAAWIGDISNFNEHCAAVDTIGPTGNKILSPHYKVEIDLSTEPFGDDYIISEDLATEIIRYWEYLRPVSKFAHYHFLLSPIGKMDELNESVSLYDPLDLGLCDTKFIGTDTLAVTAGPLTRSELEDGTMELNAGWQSYSTPTTEERSSEQKHSGEYSRKFAVNAQLEGTRSGIFTTTAAAEYEYEMWVYPDDTTNVTVLVRAGDDSTNDENTTYTGLVQDAWNYISGKFTATGGDSTYIAIISPTGEAAGTWYVDDVKITKGKIDLYDRTNVFRRKVASNEWHINHDLGNTGVLTQIYDPDENILYPKNFEIVDGNNVRAHFNAGQRGRAFTAAVKDWGRVTHSHATTAASAWNITHNLGSSGASGVCYQVFTADLTENIIPENALQEDGDTLILTFPEAVTGYCFIRDDDYHHPQTALSSTWTVNHNLNARGLMCHAYDTLGYRVYPQNVALTDYNTTTLTFASPVSGSANFITFRREFDDGTLTNSLGVSGDPEGYWKIGDGSTLGFDPQVQNDLDNITASGGISDIRVTSDMPSGSILIDFEVPVASGAGGDKTITEMGVFDKNKNLQYYTKTSTLFKPWNVQLDVKYRISKLPTNNINSATQFDTIYGSGTSK